jgi:hypothetical protein
MLEPKSLDFKMLAVLPRLLLLERASENRYPKAKNVASSLMKLPSVCALLCKAVPMPETASVSSMIKPAYGALLLPSSQRLLLMQVWNVGMSSSASEPSLHVLLLLYYCFCSAAAACCCCNTCTAVHPRPHVAQRSQHLDAFSSMLHAVQLQIAHICALAHPSSGLTAVSSDSSSFSSAAGCSRFISDYSHKKP